jgi:hypothetical protein
MRGINHALPQNSKKEKRKPKMATREFDAHEWKKKPQTVSFKTKEGEKVKFVARKETRVPVHVRFKTNDRKSR